MVVLCVVFKRNDINVELIDKNTGDAGVFISLIFWRLGRQCSDILIPILRHSLDCNFATVQCVDSIYQGFRVLPSVVRVRCSGANRLQPDVEC